MELKKGVVVVVLPIRDIGIIIDRVSENEWLVQYFDQQVRCHKSVLVPISETTISGPYNKEKFEMIRNAAIPRAIAILVQQIQELSREVEKIYYQIKSLRIIAA